MPLSTPLWSLLSARNTLHLDELRHMLRAWRRIALMTERDPRRHRETLAAIAEIQRTRKKLVGLPTGQFNERIVFGAPTDGCAEH
jgi:hypothetical protein